MTRFRRILCASDFSKISARALALAIDVAKANQARLLILYVFVPIVPVMPGGYIDVSTWAKVDPDTRRWVERQLARLADRARKAGVRASTRIVIGAPAPRIVRIARSNHSDLIVVGTHGRSALSKIFLGSVAERVIATAPCPVMTVRGK